MLNPRHKEFFENLQLLCAVYEASIDGAEGVEVRFRGDTPSYYELSGTGVDRFEEMPSGGFNNPTYHPITAAID
jgi:hypothetical protein